MKEEVFVKLAEFFITAFSIVVGLAWADAVKSLFATDGPLYFVAASGVWIYAILISLIAIFITLILGKITGKYFGKELDLPKK